MAKTFGFGLKGFASGFQTGLGLGMERRKLDALLEEQKRAEKLAEEKEKQAYAWYSKYENELRNFHTQTQNVRNMLIFESIKYKEEWTDYLRDAEDFLQAGELEDLKHLNDMMEEKIKAEADAFKIGITPENAFIGRDYTEEDMKYVQQLQIGKMAGGKTGEAMGREMWRGKEFGELPAEEPEAQGITDYTSAANYLSKFKNAPPETFSKIKLGLQKQFPNIDLTAITQESLVAPEVPPEGEITSGEKRAWDMASSVLFGSSDFVTGISKPGIISLMISSKLNMGQTLTEEEITEVRNNYNMIKDTLPNEIISVVEGQLQRYGIPLEAPVITPEIKPPTPEAKPGILQRIGDKVGGWLDMKGAPAVTQGIEEIPTPEVPTGAKEAMIPMMTKKELEEAIEGLDPSDPLYKLIYEEAVKRGYITK